MEESVPKQFIAVIDCNNFFVSCERVFRPDLAGKPVIVLSSNDGCVIARSQEVKDIGVPMGIPVFQIKDIIKDKGITLFSSNFTLYRDFSRRVFTVVQSLFTEFEQYSIDEAFIAIHDVDEAMVVQRARALKQAVFQLTGIPVSVGIGQSKTQAKYANTRAKRHPQGVFLTTDAWWQQNAATISVGDIWGVGRQLRERYRRHGITTVAEIFSTSVGAMQNIGGVVAIRLKQELSGTSVYLVERQSKPTKSVMSSRSFGILVTDKATLLSACMHHLNSVVATLEEQQLIASTMVVYLEEKHPHPTHKYYSIPIRLAVPTRQLAVLIPVLLQIVDRVYCDAVAYRKAGILMQGLMPETVTQPGLFEALEPPAQVVSRARATALQEIVADLQQQYSRHIVNIGSNTHHTVWQSRRACMSKGYTTSWTDLCLVRA